jgi:Cellulase (glycosyl hydrolase family 5)
MAVIVLIDYHPVRSTLGHSRVMVQAGYDYPTTIWKPAQRDFLLGNADHYTGLVSSDLVILKATLDRAHAAGLKVVITPLTLPGARWKQNNNGHFDDRLWHDKAYWIQAAAFWHDLAGVLKGHPAIAAYNLLNEPAPEFKTHLAEHANIAVMQRWYQNEKHSARDLLAFYNTLIKNIREVDPVTPIMVDSGWYAAADAFDYWPSLLTDSSQRILYSFHMYEPYAATSAPNLKRANPYNYPGIVPFGGHNELWDSQRVAAYLQKPLDWAKLHKLSYNRLVVGELGCIRKLPGCRQYLDDVLNALDKYHLHWAFYSFREDSWDGMDYELGKNKVPWAYWKAIDEGKVDPIKRTATPEFAPIQKRLN